VTSAASQERATIASFVVCRREFRGDFKQIHEVVDGFFLGRQKGRVGANMTTFRPAGACADELKTRRRYPKSIGRTQASHPADRRRVEDILRCEIVVGRGHHTCRAHEAGVNQSLAPSIIHCRMPGAS
jgi:hypothetical protein